MTPSLRAGNSGVEIGGQVHGADPSRLRRLENSGGEDFAGIHIVERLEPSLGCLGIDLRFFEFILALLVDDFGPVLLKLESSFRIISLDRTSIFGRLHLAFVRRVISLSQHRFTFAGAERFGKIFILRSNIRHRTRVDGDALVFERCFAGADFSHDSFLT
jgi:hypothetical protein